MTIQEIKVPNIGDLSNVEVIEVLVSPGDKVEKEASLITLESEKASMEIPSPLAGIIETVKMKIGDKVSEGDCILTLRISEANDYQEEEAKEAKLIEKKDEEISVPIRDVGEQDKLNARQPIEINGAEQNKVSDEIHAGPAVRRLAREFGIDLAQIYGSGPKQRILKEDLQKYVKTVLHEKTTAHGLQVAKIPEIDFSKFGEIERVPLNKIKKLTGANVHRSWITIPHVTQFGQADITDLDEFRKSQSVQLEKQGIKLTPLVFIMKAVVAALKKFPHFNASLDSTNENLIVKSYFNLGIAVDTPNGLVVPVVRNVDQKTILELAAELSKISNKAREKGLTVAEMSGSCFTISSLGGIGGTAFTPIINAPDVAILGISKSMMTPVYQQGQFIPRLMLPLSLSYDHRVIDGADGARFLVYLTTCLADIRTLLL